MPQGSPAAPSSERPRPARILADNLEELVAVVLLCLIGVAIALQVFMRSVLNAPLSWPEELSQFFFVWASVLGAVGAAKRSGLVRMESIVEKLPAPIRAAVDYVILGAIAALLGVLAWKGLQFAARTTYAATTLPITWGWMYAAAPVMGVLLYARLLQAQVFKYRFAFIEAVLARSARAVERDDAT